FFNRCLGFFNHFSIVAWWIFHSLPRVFSIVAWWIFHSLPGVFSFVAWWIFQSLPGVFQSFFNRCLVDFSFVAWGFFIHCLGYFIHCLGFLHCLPLHFSSSFHSL